MLFRESDQSMVELVVSAAPQTQDRSEFLSTVTRYLRHHPELISVWAGYSGDQRVSRGAYFKLGGRAEVGMYTSAGYDDASGPYSDIRHYDDPAEACADFLWRVMTNIQENPCWPTT
jgi:hypothetical protein